MLDDRIGNDSNLTPGAAPDACADKIGDMARRLKDRPVKLQAFILGLGHQGLATRPAVASALAPFLKLPPPEPRTQTRARMAKTINECVAAKEHVTREDLEAAGFSAAEITSLFREALRVARVSDMAA